MSLTKPCTLRINASEIALITNFHKYGTKEKYLDLFISNLYKNQLKLKHKDELEDIKIETTTESINSLINTNLQDILSTSLQTITDTSTLNDCTYTIANVVNTMNVDNNVKEFIKSNLTDRINQAYGHKTESKAIKLYESKTNDIVYDNNIKAYYKKYGSFSICGRIDGLIDKDGVTYINEVKNRRNCIFNIIPLYERIQLLTYTKLVGINNIIFMQCKDEEYKIDTLVDFNDEELWNDILNRLTGYCELIYQLRRMHVLRREFLKIDNNVKYDYLKSRLNWL